MLPYIGNSADEFDDPENGDYLDRLEQILRSSKQLDSLVLKIALDRTHYFLDSWERSFFYGGNYEIIPNPYPDASRFKLALETTDVIDSTGLKALLLDYIETLQSVYFWGECLNPDLSMISKLSEIITENKINEPIVFDFLTSNILQPWEEFLCVDDLELEEAQDVQAWIDECNNLLNSDRFN